MSWFLLLPLQLVLLLVFATTDVVAFLARRLRRRSNTSVPALADPLCSIVVVTWNGRHLLEESLPALLRAVARQQQNHQLLVVDNGSTDGTVGWLEDNFPQVEVLPLSENLGFGEGNNLGVRQARHDVVVLLNNDMIVAEDFLSPLLSPFSDPTVFAVSAQINFPAGKRREETGNTFARLEKGYLHLSHEPISRWHYTRRNLPILWAGGGSSAFRKDRFLELGGFSSLFSPCYVEDTDLSYRAWRRGWKVLLAADSKVLHKHRSTSQARFDVKQVDRLIEERKLWYLWKNFQLRTLLPHFLLFPLQLYRWIPLGVYLSSLRRLPKVLKARWSEPIRAVDDRELAEWIRLPVTYLNHFHPQRTLHSRNPQDPLRILTLSAYLPHLGTHGGAGRVYQLIKRIAEKHEVSVLTFLESSEEEPFLHQLQGHAQRVETVLRRGFEPISPFPYEPFEEFNSPEFRQRLAELLAELDFDIIDLEWTQMAQFADLCGDTRRLLTEIEVNYAAHQTLIATTSNPLVKLARYYRSLQTLYREVQLCRKVHQIICVTEEDRGYLKPFLPHENLKVVNTGVDENYFRYSPAGIEPHTLLFVGAFRHAPNVDAMLWFCREIFPAVQRQVPAARLLIAGSGPPPEIQALERNPAIRITGYLEDIRTAYHKAQVVVVPIRTGVGIRGKILEGWAVGRATVATSLACQGIRTAHGHNILIADTPQDFARWTSALLSRPDFCRLLGQRGRQTVEQHYSWDILAQQLTEIIENPVGSRTARAQSQTECPDR